MTDDYTPTTGEVRAAYSQARCEFDPDMPEVEDTDTEFDRWLNREIAHAVAAEREAIAGFVDGENTALYASADDPEWAEFSLGAAIRNGAHNKKPATSGP